MKKKTRNWMIAVVGLISVGTFTAESHAIPVPDAIYQWGTQGPLGYVIGSSPIVLSSDNLIAGETQSGTITWSDCTQYGCFTGTATTTPDLLAQVTGTFTGLISGAEAGPLGSVNNFPATEVQGSAGIQYYFEILGPANQFVPLTITGSLSSSSVAGDINAYANTTGQILYQYVDSGGSQNGAAISCSSLNNSCGGLPTSVSLSASFSQLTNSIGTVTLLAGGTTAGAVSSSYSVTADPIISINPTFLANNPGYSLVFSSNISAPQPASVPEPSTILLFGAGLVGLVAWRRKQAA